MAIKKHYTPAEAVAYLNEKLKPDQPLDVVRLARLRREKRIKGEKLEGTNFTIYTHKALDMVTLNELLDKRKTGTKTP